MRVLIACECSGRVRDAFLALGHDAWSNDLESSETPGPHIVGDAREVMLSEHWDLMIAHPPCTYLSGAGSQWWFKDEQSVQNQLEALNFVRALMAAPIDRIAIENPQGRIGTAIRKADQYVHPWWFGDPFYKRTGLWLKNLPLLTPDRPRPEKVSEFANSFSPSPTRQKDRSRTFLGVARAMAEQWGGTC